MENSMFLAFMGPPPPPRPSRGPDNRPFNGHGPLALLILVLTGLELALNHDPLLNLTAGLLASVGLIALGLHRLWTADERQETNPAYLKKWGANSH